VIDYDRKFDRNTARQFEPVNAGETVWSCKQKRTRLVAGKVKNKQNVGGIKLETHSGNFSYFKKVI
jgi:hypothetical protein